MAGIWLDALDDIARTCQEHGRGDLLQAVRLKRAHLLDPALTVLVVGEPNQGKSQLVNAIVNAPVCPVGDGTTTVLPTVLRHAEVATATVVQTPLPVPGTAPAADPPAVQRTPVPTDQIAAGVAGSTGRQPGGGPAYIEIGLPRALLGAGVVLVDMPGGDVAAGAGTPVAALTRADTVLLVTDSTGTCR
ncbi:hypothetical protein GCM10029963_04530 [Micromonospora andamanensis]